MVYLSGHGARAGSEGIDLEALALQGAQVEIR